jgi:hypothetical protein
VPVDDDGAYRLDLAKETRAMTMTIKADQKGRRC